ncbi:hypothetical protein PAHAL_1G418400 [Panicum hallii]|uniref:Knottin scorpion toxin-like domain-containing protein n=1 Tax=Panicum hallii TaxID=206008 RepID=A0A2S3GTZ1_9POAL|nr:hypothetical protein PAHAL_1G418400 [Panicum hallii]
MRTCHGALLLAVAMVLLSTGICTARAPAPGLDEFQLEYSAAPAPGPGFDELPPEYSCLKILYSGGCDAKTCDDKCLSQLKGNGQCIDKACRCSYLCKPPPLDI